MSASISALAGPKVDWVRNRATSVEESGTSASAGGLAGGLKPSAPVDWMKVPCNSLTGLAAVWTSRKICPSLSACTMLATVRAPLA